MQDKRSKIVFILLFLISIITRGQDPSVIQNYIDAYKDIAIKEMQRTGVPASIKLAQGIHETMAGTSDLVLKSNNHFGIKCKNTWLGASVTHDDDLRGECFRKYSSALDSYRDHSDFLRSSPRYSFLFNLEPTDYKDWAHGLKKAGYATNPRYPQIIIKLIEDYHLQDYTLIAMGKMPVIENAIAKTSDIQVIQKPEEPEIMIPASIEETSKIEKTPKAEFLQKKDVLKAEGSLTKEDNYKIEETPKVIQSTKLVDRPTYPYGEFKINETRVIYARKGTSFLAIAQQYNIPLARIFEFNDIEKREVVNKDQLIYIQRKRKTGNNDFHIVQQGETLPDIAQSEAIRLESLREYNLLTVNMKPAVGEKLYLRSKAQTAPQLALKDNYSLYQGVSGSLAANNNGNGATDAKTLTGVLSITYTVQPKETIYAISKKYNVSIDDIVKWNQLSSNDLKMGQQLKIYK